MTTLLLVRHGHTEAVGKRLVGRMPGIELDREGLAQADGLGRLLALAPLRAVYSSPLERAERTARAIAGHHGLPVVLRERLTDIEFGEWTGRTIDELQRDPRFARFNTDRAGTAPPGGELAAAVQARMVAELCELRDRHPEEAIAIVGHCDPLRAAIAYFAGMPLHSLLRFEIDPGSLSRLDLSPRGASLRYLNRDAAAYPSFSENPP